MPQVLNCWQLSIQFNLIFNRPCGFNCTSCRIVHPGVHRFLRLFLSVTSSQVASPSIRQLRYSSGIRAIKGEREVPTGQCLFSQSACVCSLPSFGYLSVLLDNYFLLKNLARHGAPTYNPSRQKAEAIEWQVSTSILCLNSTLQIQRPSYLFFYLELKILVIFACFLPSTPISSFVTLVTI